MNDLDKETIRQIIREELDKRFTLTIPFQKICTHEWIFNSGGSHCIKCGLTSNTTNPYPTYSKT